MPSEDGLCSIEDTPQQPAAEKNGGHHHHHHHHGYQKLLHIFRFKKKASKPQPQDVRGEGQQQQPQQQEQGPEQRRQQLERDMRTNWEELPATLKRRKERLSQAVLAEFHSEHESSAASSAGSEPPSAADSISGVEPSPQVKQNGGADTDSSASSSSAENGADVGTALNGSDSPAKVNGEGQETSSSATGASTTMGKQPEGEEKSKAVNGSGAAGGERKEDADDVTCHAGARPTGHPEAAAEPAVGGQGSEAEPSDTGSPAAEQNGQDGAQNGDEKCEGQEGRRRLDGAALLEQERLSLRELERLRQNLHLALSSATDLDREQRYVVELLRQAVSSEEYLLLNTSSSSSASSSSPSSASSRSSSMSDPCPASPPARTERPEERDPDVVEAGYEDMRPDPSAVEAYYDAIVRQSDEEPPLPFVVIPKATALDRASALETKRRRAEDACDRPRPSRWKRQLAESARPPGCSMDTIVEEDEKLSVREILRRFEQLGAGALAHEGPEEKSATLRQIQDTLRSLEEKVRHYDDVAADQQLHQKQQPVISALDGYHHHHQQQHQQQQQQQQTQLQHQQVSLQQQQQQQHQRTSPQHGSPRRAMSPSPGHNHLDAWTGRPQHTGSVLTTAHELSQQQYPHQQHTLPNQHDGKHSLLQFAMLHFRQSPEKFEMLKAADGSISGSLKVIESLKSKKNKSKKGNKENEWTWKEQVDLVKFSSSPIEQSLLRLDSVELNDLAIECFVSIMRYMGDLPMPTDVTEVKCVYTILMHCHKHEQLRDEVYCQLMKQTTNNKSTRPDSCQRGWRLFSIVAAYFVCSDVLRPYLFKYLETAAYDKRRAYHGTATVCLHNLRKTFKYGGRKNVPSVEEITAISAGRNSKRQIYRLPGGTERVVNTKCTTVVQDVIEEMCAMINVQSPAEMDEFSLYCIVEGDTFTMPLAREEYVLDVTTELHKNQQVFYLIFCRSVWHFPLRLDSHLYIEVVFNQIAPDYLEGLLLVMPGEQLEQDVIYDIAKMAALLHRAADMTHLPTMKETKFLLPKPALSVRDVKPAQWVNMVQSNWHDVQGQSTIQAKAQVLDILSKWPLFGSSFFAVKRVSDPKERSEHILALNRHGVHFIDLVTHETLIHYPFSEVISTRKVKSEDGTLFLDMKCGNLMQQRITRLQTDQAHEISRLIRQYITMEQRLRHS